VNAIPNSRPNNSGIADTADLGTHPSMNAQMKSHKTCVALSATVQYMSTTITQRDLRNNNADIMRRLEDGETFIITRNGKQVGVLTPMTRPQFARMTDVLEAFKGLPPLSFEEFRRDIDEFIDQDPTPRFFND
jgi:prevent-host-death family protein